MNIFNNLISFHSSILDWYAKYGRKELPWRNLKRDGSESYKIYVSEIMLQQTQVNRVLNLYYFPFLKRFNSLKILASCSTEDILLLWQGLGYYSRAVNMQKTARICVENFNGILPDSQKILLSLPGIGEYTAGAILCFGFGRSVSFVDANIKRLFCRLLALKSPSQKEINDYAYRLLNYSNSFDYNQALLDIGSTICTSKNPKCLLCPIYDYCRGRNFPLNYPISKSRIYQDLSINILILESESKIALIHETKKLYNGLYNLPLISEDILNSTSYFQFLGDFKHSYTKYRITARVFKIKEQYYTCINWILEQAQINNKLSFFRIDNLPPISNLTKKALSFFWIN